MGVEEGRADCSGEGQRSASLSAPGCTPKPWPAEQAIWHSPTLSIFDSQRDAQSHSHSHPCAPTLGPPRLAWRPSRDRIAPAAAAVVAVAAESSMLGRLEEGNLKKGKKVKR